MKPAKAIFLDRDGVILNDEGQYYIHEAGKVVINPGVMDGLGRLVRQGYGLVVVSNQSGIGKGLYGIAEADEVNQSIITLFQPHQIPFLGFWYCPHHPDQTQCFCRKPASLLFERAIGLYGIDPATSWMIGDRPRDIQAANKAGIRGILLPSNAGFQSAVDTILSHEGR